MNATTRARNQQPTLLCSFSPARAAFISCVRHIIQVR
jgi:hypothetical protein